MFPFSGGPFEKKKSHRLSILKNIFFKASFFSRMSDENVSTSEVEKEKNAEKIESDAKRIVCLGAKEDGTAFKFGVQNAPSVLEGQNPNHLRPNPFGLVHPLGQISMAQFKGFGFSYTDSSVKANKLGLQTPVFGQVSSFGAHQKLTPVAHQDPGIQLKSETVSQTDNSVIPKVNPPAVTKSKHTIRVLPCISTAGSAPKPSRPRLSRAKGSIHKYEKIRDLRKLLSRPVLQIFPETCEPLFSESHLEATHNHKIIEGHAESEYQTFQEFQTLCIEVSLSFGHKHLLRLLLRLLLCLGCQLDEAEESVATQKHIQVQYIQHLTSQILDKLQFCNFYLQEEKNSKEVLSNLIEQSFITEFNAALMEIKENHSDPLWQPALWTEESRIKATSWTSSATDALIRQFIREKRVGSGLDNQSSLVSKAFALNTSLCNLEDFWEHVHFDRRAYLLKNLRKVIPLTIIFMG